MAEFSYEQIISEEWSVDVIQRWSALLAVEVRKYGLDINPFTGKTKKKSLINSEGQKKAVRIWGVHPNVADDPAQYPALPREGWHKTKPYDAPLYGSVIRRMDRGQEHWGVEGKGAIFKHPNVYNSSKSFDDYFQFKGKLYGKLSKDNNACVPIYSVRSIPQMLVEQNELQYLIVDTFNRAYDECRGGVK
jgi:hypothetical protein